MKNILIKNNELNNIDINNYTLSILITQDGLSYSLYSISENKFQSLISKKFESKDNYLGEIESFIKEEQLNLKIFANINVIYANNKVTIIPEAIFDEHYPEKIYKLNFFHEENEKVFYTRLNKSSNVIVFSADKDLVGLLDSLFLRYKLLPQSFSFIESNFIKNRISENREVTKMFIQVFENFMDILVLKDNKILLYNTFCFKTNNDILYFIINVFEQLKLSQEDTEVSFSGLIETDSLAVLNLKKFVRIVYFESQNNDYKYFYKFQEIAPHYFVNFFNIN